MKIISWNIRDMGSSVKKRFLTKLIKERNPDVIMIQETKIEKFEVVAVQRLWGNTRVWELEEIMDLVKTRMAI
ncbi:hypothetical protein RHMOL_Rhmol03G0107200 [Rhododendron molle]|uniref:Uncharacterized protein n=1 Tax=Rhododendron molle TaxID=49168 RepID=A0ACC0PCK2_RHOML|nr:hypothetical protein RHMOL_Rhmol03G0107200 [Rhododendron molle]